jgi:hypothetical protein
MIMLGMGINMNGVAPWIWSDSPQVKIASFHILFSEAWQICCLKTLHLSFRKIAEILKICIF